MIDENRIVELIRRRKQFRDSIEDHCDLCRYDHVTQGMEVIYSVLNSEEEESINNKGETKE